ncbi:DUF4272 domain-containing protein [Chitinimonas lacunae]|uniref:DUF4272 domain-containing protein n=1 Tax=Chitinimonas lacunae TaxID=1963018 RepID=A0ABV8MJM4_9NEIS
MLSAQAALYLPVADPDLRQLFPQIDRAADGCWILPLEGDVLRLAPLPRAAVPAHLIDRQNWAGTQPGEAGARAQAIEWLRRCQTVLILQIDTDDPERAEQNLDIWESAFDLARQFDGLLLSHDSLWQPDRELLVGALCVDDLDEDFQLHPPTAGRVAQRALVMSALVCRAFLEREADEPGSAATVAQLLPWLERLGIADELEPQERALLETPLGELSQEDQVNGTWQVEGLAVLAWALGRHPLPDYQSIVQPNAVVESLDFLAPAPMLLSAPTLRPAEALLELGETLFALHWRLQQYRLEPEAMNWREFADTAWFGPLKIDSLRLVDNDLSIDGRAIDQADDAARQACHSITLERHRAINWLLGHGAVYSEVETNT